MTYKTAFYSLLIGGIFIFAGKRLYYSKPHRLTKDMAYYNRKKESFELLPKGKTVFIGDSQIEFFPTELVGAENRGIAGDDTPGVLARLNQIEGADTVFIEIGINDLQYGASPDSVFRNIERIVSKIKGKVYACTVLPFKDYSGSVNELNDKIKTLPAVIDLSSFGKDSLLPQYDSGDHLHLNNAGYRKFIKVIQDR